MMDTHYTVLSAYRLGDHYKDRGKLLAAELCYALPEITDHPINQKCSKDIIETKLNDFVHFRNTNNYQIPRKGVDIPTQALQLVKSFFAIWLNTDIKSDLIKRSEDHVHKRVDAIINIFNQVTTKYDNISKLEKKDIQNVFDSWINTYVSKIHDWKGPSFNKLQYKKNTNKLTVVMDFKEYRKRCRNSQEDWFKKYDGKFYAQCLTEIVQIFDSRLLQRDIAIVKIEFAQKFLNRKIQFPLAAARSLLPAGTLFLSDELQIALNKFHKDLNTKYLKENSNTNKVKELHLQLLAICKKAYNSLMTNSRNIPAIIAPVIDNMDEDDSFTNNNIEMLNEEFRLENHSVRNSNMFTEVRNVEGKDNYMPQRQPVPVFEASLPSLAPNQFRHFQMNPYYNTQPHNMTFLSQIQYPKSVSDTCTVSTSDSITPQTHIIIPQTNTVPGGSICCGCQEHQCRCNTRSISPQIMHYNPQSYYVNTGRQFQYSNGYLNPSQRIHNNMSIQNGRQQRRLNYHQQKKNTSTKTNISYTHDTKSSNSKMNTVREELKPEPAATGKHQSIESLKNAHVVKKKRKQKQELLEKSKQKEREEKNQSNNFLSLIKDDWKKCKNISENNKKTKTNNNEPKSLPKASTTSTNDAAKRVEKVDIIPTISCNSSSQKEESEKLKSKLFQATHKFNNGHNKCHQQTLNPNKIETKKRKENHIEEMRTNITLNDNSSDEDDLNSQQILLKLRLLINQAKANMSQMDAQYIALEQKLLPNNQNGATTCSNQPNNNSHTSSNTNSNTRQNNASSSTGNNNFQKKKNSNKKNQNDKDDDDDEETHNNDKRNAHSPLVKQCNHLNECEFCSNILCGKYEALKMFKALIQTLQTQHEYHKTFEDMVVNATLNKKSKTKFKRNKNQMQAKLVDEWSYDPPPMNVKISKTLTKNLEKQQVTQYSMLNPFKYLVKILTMQRNDGQIILGDAKNEDSRVVNVDLMDKNSQDLFCIAKKNRYNKWEICDQLFTREKLVLTKKLPSFPASSRNKLRMQCKNGIVLKNINKLVQYCKWKDVPVYNKQKHYNTQRITLGITKEILNPIIKQRLENIGNNNNKNNNELIPIVMFDNNSHLMEYIFIVQIEDNINVGISLRRLQDKGLRITGIHLDKQKILEQHELAVRHTCHCLDRFVCNIHDIRVDNPNVLIDQVKSCKQRYEKLKKFVQRFRDEKLPEQITALQRQSDLILQNDNGQLHVSQSLFSGNLFQVLAPISLQSSSSISHSTSPSPSMISTSSNDTHPSGYYSQSSQQSVCMDLNELDLSLTSNNTNTIEENKMDEDNDIIM